LEVLGREDAARIDLLFTDVVMPGGINGLVLAERARALRARLRVLLASGYSEDLLAGGAPNGGLVVVSKPYRQADLASRVRAVLDGPGEGTA
jgi:CheY-like chemotaxis protein